MVVEYIREYVRGTTGCIMPSDEGGEWVERIKVGEPSSMLPSEESALIRALIW
jgi:hypothetical protein